MTKVEKKLIFVKLGGSLITEKRTMYTINYNAIKRIAKEIKEAIDTNQNMSLLIGHGGGSFPHPIANIFKISEGFIQKDSVRGFALCQNASSTLNRILVDIMIDYGINVISIQTSACCIAKNGEISKIFLEPIKKSINNGIIPVIFGDCVFDTIKGCTIISTEQIFTYLSKYLRPSRILIFGLVDGVYTSDPQKDKKARKIPEISAKNIDSIKLKGSYAVDVTGGMFTKVMELLKIAEMGIECEIIGGKSGYIKKALAGERGLGTIIKPVSTPKK
ncbi:MAG: uridylate kinase [Thermoprotei archaeon]|nr:MAG: uridylate kinase [Thermoprotei archaeon]